MPEEIVENSNLYKNIYSNSLIKNLETYKTLEVGAFQNKYLNLFKSYKDLEIGTLQLRMRNNLLDYERITSLINTGDFQNQLATSAMRTSKLHNHFTSKNRNEISSLQIKIIQ